MGKNKNRNKNKIQKEDAIKASGKDNYEISKLKKERSEDKSRIKFQDQEIDSLKKNIEILQLKISEKKEPEQVFILDKKHESEMEIEKLMAKRELNVDTIRELKEYKLATIKAETESNLKIMDAERNSPEAQIEFYKLKMKTRAHFLLLFIGFVILGLAIYLGDFIYSSFLGALGVTFMAIGIAHFTTEEGTERAKKLLELLPKFSKNSDSANNLFENEGVKKINDGKSDSWP